MLPEANANANGAATAQIQAVDPYRNYHFKLNIQGVTQGHFTECSGLGIEVDAIEYREAGDNQVVRRIPGQVKYTDVTLRYGLTPSREMYDWLMSAVRGTVERKNISIVLLASDGATPVMQWNLNGCWPSKWLAAQLEALGHGMAIESMTLVYETLERA